jgi:anti-sigma factor RsiW
MTVCLRFAPMIGARPGELAGEEASALAEHLASCDACQGRLADEEALSGMLSEALMAEANRRDFAAFSDEVLARIPTLDRAGARRAPRGGMLAPILGWVQHHRLIAAASALAPTLAALALIVYLGRDTAPQGAPMEISSEGRSTMVLETSEGPVVLLGDLEPEGS